MQRRFLLSTLMLLSAVSTLGDAAEIAVLTPETWEQFAPQGKEVDCVYGDWVLRTNDWTAVIAKPIATRNANMTVKGIGACLIDFTSRTQPNDQLSAYYPGGTKHPFTSPANVKILVDGQLIENRAPAVSQGKSIVWECSDDSAPSASTAKPAAGTSPEKGQSSPNLRLTRRFTATEGEPFLLVETIYTNPHDSPVTEKMGDSIRADKVFTFGNDDNGKLMWVQDDWFRQTYGIQANGFRFVPVTQGNNFDFAADDAELKLAPGESKTFARKLFCGDSLVAVRSSVAKIGGTKVEPVSILVQHPLGPAAQARLIFTSTGNVVSTARTDANGRWSGHLPIGAYQVVVEYLGHPEIKQTLSVPLTGEMKIKVPEIGDVRFQVTDGQDEPIPCKVAFFGQGDLKDPDFGPDSGEVAVKNLHYSHSGTFTQSLLAGKYEALVSYGPEYDVATVTFDVNAGETTTATAKLKRVVDTRGWISSDFHNHASPSGDNVSSQRGRVLNLVCENIEFAPCTEHNRIDSYVPHLKALDILHRMATCTGIELTGSPLPINHQNAFPLVHKPRTQDGGGPTPAVDPVVQIERLSMWDGGAEKVVQMNHPNLPQILGDRDLDGQLDVGFEKMFRFTDVIEIHPVDSIFEIPEQGVDYRKYRNPSLTWLQMLNLGYRIPGVVNTDAHYNFHGSGWMRNYIRCSTDDPAKIETPEMIRETEAGHLVMTTGPFMTVELTPTDADKSGKPAIPGDDIALPAGTAELHVKVQCPNWLDINRVQVFLNGRPEKSLNFLRRENSSHFSNGVVKFEAHLPLNLKTDTHLVVACIGENMSLGRVFGSQYGKQPPVALANPIFVDVDGNGFQANGDLLDAPLLFDKANATRGK